MPKYKTLLKEMEDKKFMPPPGGKITKKIRGIRKSKND